MGTKSFLKYLAETTHVLVGLAFGFKRCCMLTGEHDGSDRDHFF
jgi:hypothetical protein